ncbi:MAG: hypothetical protein GC181_12660 [Bacteroidetes bacterium]|nr:hypothetical protein [Bacteroidota bacterium]
MKLDLTPIGEYKISASWKVFHVVLFISLGIASYLFLIKGNAASEAHLILQFLLGIGLCFFCMFTLIWAFKTRLIITDSTIKVIGLWKIDEIYFDDILGFRLTFESVSIEPKNSDQKTITFPTIYENKRLWRSFLIDNFNNLTVQDEIDKQSELKAERKEILHNPDFGNDRKERKQNLSKARSFSRKFRISTWIAVVIYFFQQNPPKLFSVLIILLPLFAFAIAIFGKGKYTVLLSEKYIHPSLSLVVFIPTLCIFIKATQYNILESSTLWLITSGIAVIALALVLYIEKDLRKELNYLVALILFPAIIGIAMCYGYSSAKIINCIYDTSLPVFHDLIIKDKKTKRSKRTDRYYLVTTPIIPPKDYLETEVNEDWFNTVSNGDTISALEFKGFLGIPWYVLIE